MADRNEHGPPIEQWRLWLGRLVLIPLFAMSGGMIYGLHRAVVTGKVSTVSKGYRVSSNVYHFTENPILFLLFFTLFLALAGLVIFVTIVVARRVIPRSGSK